jgi:hypothetical protein
MNTARRTTLFAAIALGLAVSGSCAKGATSVDEDLTEAAGGSLDEREICGNGFIDEDKDEECDPGKEGASSNDKAAGEKLGRATCETLGFSAGGTLTCDPETCIYDTSLCKLPPVTMMPSGGNGG